jgi:arylformamidase
VPVAIFVHGGAWHSGSASEFTFLAEPFVHAGAHFAVLDFTNVNDTGGSLFPMVEQVRRAIGWVFRNAEQFGGDRDRLYLISHSSGSHLAGCAVTHDWSKDGLPHHIVKGATLSSGMYDLKPVRLSKRSQYVNFTDAIENELSAIRHLDRLATPLIVSYGTYETPEFQRQTRDFAAAVKAVGKPVQLLVGEAYNHFEMLETLGNPYGLLGRAVLAQMGLT